MTDDTALAPEPTETPDVSEEADSLSDHELVFSPEAPKGLDGEAKVKAEEKRTTGRHRANSQQASPDDVDVISTLTAKIRALEDAGGIERKAGESERVYRLRARSELLERATKPVEAPKPATPAPKAEAAAPPVTHDATKYPAIEPTRARPKIEDIGATYEDWDAYQGDIVNWTIEQRDHAAKITSERDAEVNQRAALQKEWDTDHSSMAERVTEFKKAHPDYDSLLASNTTDVPPAVYKAILKHDNGPAFVYHLIRHPEDMAEVAILFDGKPPSPQFVALATRWLTHRAKVETTGSTAPEESLKPGPRPPNPVRTGPTKASDDIPSDDSPLSAHEARFKPKGFR